MRLLLLFFILALLFTIPFLIWGDELRATFSEEGAVAWLRQCGSWAWAAAIALLVTDVVLPIPATAVMAALGFTYGVVVGGLIGSVGSFLAGMTAYAACRWLGRGAALRIAGARDLERGEELFSSVGGWLVALSRWLPLLPEVVTCMAGLARMPLGTFSLALACGCVPMAFTFAAVGHVGGSRPALSLTLSALLPLAIWPVASYWIRSKGRGAGEAAESGDR